MTKATEGESKSKYEGDERTAGEIISDEKKGSINKEFPEEWRDSTFDEIDKAARNGNAKAKTARKLLTSNDFNKGSNSSRTNKGH